MDFAERSNGGAACRFPRGEEGKGCTPVEFSGEFLRIGEFSRRVVER